MWLTFVENTIFSIGINSMQDWTATTRNEVTREKRRKIWKAHKKDI